MPKQAYTQKFRKEWLQEGFCKDWIMEIPGDANNARCKYCNSVFRAKLYDIKEHAKMNRVVLPTQAHRIDPFTCNLEEYLSPRITLGYEAEKKLLESSITPDQEKNLRNRCSEFLIELIRQLRQRLPDNIKVLKTMSVLSVSQTLRVVKDSICPLLESMNFSSEIIAKADMQWSNITLIKWSETKDTVKFWVEVLQYKDAANSVPFLELATCALTIVSLPHSNAEVERIFSQMNLVKNKLRNKMKTDTVNAILHIRYGLKRMEKTCSTYEFPNDVLDSVKGNTKYLTRTASPDQPTASSGYVMADEDDEQQDIFIEEL
ncbi:hypothetical protein Pcinc_009497 [Petrolisthes cinctipes]|uniref:HAT C-terminal dimerisation domain-containing protein n=1 Tax=Petrolisthes cinctipes TaxID=88211 RepID=A0AAE1KUR8_PETCI|nr:hypothetical protein Pcinc_009497 [Petrolisthes cinctipes]